MKGIIKKLSENGFGFITPDNGGKDVFFHANDVADEGFKSLQEGDAVMFQMGESPKGPKATDVKVAGAETSAEAEAAPSEESSEE
ncbi:cold shock domain-containing protein [Patescibacteria group bacterium]|nr:cold shock domain-containing protein [Patescibacteria group bacterium]MBU1703098.1 cold shock domain-containing protein [Patescibacteria group bacterium]MBU1954274.1 cold shock domain-containing protein [Patescibacteria group bacterium]